MESGRNNTYSIDQSVLIQYIIYLTIQLEDYIYSQSNTTLIVKGRIDSLIINGSNNKIIIKRSIDSLIINGSNNKITLQRTIDSLIINGSQTKIDATHRNCFLDDVIFNGSNNIIEINQNSQDLSYIQNGRNNKIYMNNNNRNVRNNNRDNSISMFISNSQNMPFNLDEVNSFCKYNIYNSLYLNIVLRNFSIFSHFDNIFNNEFFNDAFNNANNSNNAYNDNIVNNVNNVNNANIIDNVGDDNNNNSREENEQLFLNKKRKYIHELDEFKYKNIKKFSDKEGDICSICIMEFKGSNIIKKFPCNHIFHKDCISQWLKKSNRCPLCNHDITEEVNNVKIKSEDDDE